MNWILDLLDRITSFIPRLYYVQPDEAGVRVTCGNIVKVICPGLWLFLPVVQTITIVVVTPQVVDLRGQSVISNGKDYIISGAIMYRIDNAEKAILAVQDFDRSLQVLSLGIIANYSKSHDLSHPDAFELLQTEILKGVREAASGWGLKIMKVYLTDLGNVSNIRVIGNTTVVPIVGDE